MEGYYWLFDKTDREWFVGFYDHTRQSPRRWTFTGTDCYYSDSEMEDDFIIGKRIPEPSDIPTETYPVASD